MKTYYHRTSPGFWDTVAIAKEKLLQVQRGQVEPGRYSGTIYFPDIHLNFHDTKLSVIQKLLYSNGNTVAPGVEIAVTAVVAFDGTYVDLSWSTPAGAAAGDTYTIYRDDVPIAEPNYPEITYRDNDVDPGETYVYRLFFNDNL